VEVLVEVPVVRVRGGHTGGGFRALGRDTDELRVDPEGKLDKATACIIHIGMVLYDYKFPRSPYEPSVR
jgi:hypothetical protein